jgi:hypothetical protein
MAATWWDVEYTDADGHPHKSRAQTVNGLHTGDKAREDWEHRNLFGKGSTITKITKLTDTAQIAAAAASRPELPPAIVKQIQVAETEANPPAAAPQS